MSNSAVCAGTDRPRLRKSPFMCCALPLLHTRAQNTVVRARLFNAGYGPGPLARRFSSGHLPKLWSCTCTLQRCGVCGVSCREIKTSIRDRLLADPPPPTTCSARSGLDLFYTAVWSAFNRCCRQNAQQPCVQDGCRPCPCVHVACE